jgi:hypothetical protein
LGREIESHQDINCCRLSLQPTQHLNLLNAYLDLVRVALPDWVLDIQHQQLPANPPLPHAKSKTTKQIQVPILPKFTNIGLHILVTIHQYFQVGQVFLQIF